MSQRRESAGETGSDSGDDAAPRVERRRHPRVKMSGTGGQVIVAAPFKILSLSESGASVEMALPLPLGTHCEVRLKLEATLEIRTRVEHASPSGDVHVMGVGFRSLSPFDRALLAAFLRRERGERR